MSTNSEIYKIKKNIDGDDSAVIAPNDVIEKKYDIEKSLKYQIEKAEELGVDTFYVSFYWRHDPLMSGMMGTHKDGKYSAADCGELLSNATYACPTPHFNQMVYKYDHGHIEVLWFIPTHKEFWQILKGEITVAPEVKFWVTSAYNGDLFKFVDKENGEDTIGKQLLVVDPSTLQ